MTALDRIAEAIREERPNCTEREWLHLLAEIETVCRELADERPEPDAMAVAKEYAFQCPEKTE